jgi:hypothetical protein
MTNTTPHPNHKSPSQAVPTSQKKQNPERPCDHGCTNELVKSPSISTKGIARESNPTPTEGKREATPRNEDNLASTFGTLLSSQGADAHQQDAFRQLVGATLLA